MKSVSIKNLAIAGMLVSVGILIVLGGQSRAVSSYRDCADDAILRCGAVSESELLQKYDANEGDIQNIYGHYGIGRDVLNDESGDVRHGTVYQDGRVVVDGKTVATNAYSVSRVRFTSAGTPREVTVNGTTLYEGPSMAIFVRPVDAYVFFQDDEFQNAILSACGNPLMATPVHTVKPVKQVVDVEQPEQPVQPQPVVVTEVVEETPQALPQTGIVNVLSGGVGVGSITAASYYWVTSRKNLFLAHLKRQ